MEIVPKQAGKANSINRLIKELQNNVEDYDIPRPDYCTHTICRRKALKQVINLLTEYRKLLK